MRSSAAAAKAIIAASDDVVSYVRKHGSVSVSTIKRALEKKHPDTDVRAAVWKALADNRLHALTDWTIRLKRKTDWMVED